jgi:uncharacterized protein (DUF2267 family)
MTHSTDPPGAAGAEVAVMCDVGPSGPRGTSLPEDARLRPPSKALDLLLSAAMDTGIGPHRAGRVVHAVLSTFLQRLPEGERRHVAAHLPPDVRRLATTREHVGRSGRAARTVAELTSQVMTVDGLSAEQAGRVIAAVLGTLRLLVPEEAADVASVLPSELRVLWETAGGGSDRPPNGRSGSA